MLPAWGSLCLTSAPEQLSKKEKYMSMTRLVYGLAALPLIMGVAFAAPVKQDSKSSAKQPMQLTEQQMDKVTAGWDIIETDCSNTHCTWLSIYENRTASVPLTGVADFGTG